MITIFFDASPLALWSQSQAHRTGVGRVAVNILRSFLRQSNVHVVLLCPRGMQFYVLDFINNNPWAKHAFFPYTQNYLAPPTWKVTLKSYFVYLLRKMPVPLQAHIKKILQPLPYREFREVDEELHNIIAERLPKQGRVLYFSAYDPIPSTVCQFPSIERHVFLHDIIPLRIAEKHFGTHMTLQLCKDHIERANVIWCNSEFTKNDFLDYFPDVQKEKCKVTYLGKGTEFSPATNSDVEIARQQCRLLRSTPFVLSAATLEPRKGMRYLIQAFEKLLSEKKLSDFRLVLVGQKGWAYSEILKTVTHKDKICFSGFLEDNLLAALMTDCACFAYLSEYEGFGLPIVEAMACGAVVVASNATSIPEVTGDAALLVPPKDVDSIASSLYEICTNADKRSQLKQKSLLQAEKFTWDKCVEIILEPLSD